MCSGEHACNARGKFAVRAVVDGDQQSLEIGDEPALLELLALDPLLLLLAHREAISAQRSVGGMAVVVMTAMATIIVKRSD